MQNLLIYRSKSLNLGGYLLKFLTSVSSRGYCCATRPLRSQQVASIVLQPPDLRCRASMKDDRKIYISDAIRAVPDFPKTGINFHDVTTLLLNAQAFKWSIEDFVDRYRDQDLDAIIGIEARGFIFGAALAIQLGLPFVPLRKPGKLPGETVSAEYVLEYGTDKIEMHLGAVSKGQKVVIIDDLIATGGTLAAAVSLLHKVEAVVVEAACVIEMPALEGRGKLGDTPLYAQIVKDGE